MDSKETKEYDSSRCYTFIWIKFLFLTQGIVLVAVCVVGLFIYTSPDVECMRLKLRNILLLALACFHVIASFMCCLHCKDKRSNGKLFIAYVFWGCAIGSLLTFQTLRFYEYIQTITQYVLYAVIMTTIFDILVFIACGLYVVEICKSKPGKSDSLESPFSYQPLANTNSLVKICDTYK